MLPIAIICRESFYLLTFPLVLGVCGLNRREPSMGTLGFLSIICILNWDLMTAWSQGGDRSRTVSALVNIANHPMGWLHGVCLSVYVCVCWR